MPFGHAGSPLRRLRVGAAAVPVVGRLIYARGLGLRRPRQKSITHTDVRLDISERRQTPQGEINDETVQSIREPEA